MIQLPRRCLIAFHMWDAYGVKQAYAFKCIHRLQASVITTTTKKPTTAPTAEMIDGSIIMRSLNKMAAGGFKYV